MECTAILVYSTATWHAWVWDPDQFGLGLLAPLCGNPGMPGRAPGSAWIRGIRRAQVRGFGHAYGAS